MKFNARFWIKFSLVNLFIVALLGALMRYKIGFHFPYFSQKYIQHAHSHFAFSGWVTHSLYVLLIFFISNRVANNHLKQYKNLLIINLILSYGLLISYFFFGYNFSSIALSTLTIVNNCFLAYFFFNDFKKFTVYHPSIAWFKSAIWFNLISSLGTFYLAYMLGTRNFNENLYLSSIYFYLHFQYNGFFSFVCFGLIVNRLADYVPTYKYNKILFYLFFFACIPSYFLSILWAKLPFWVYVITVISAFVQLLAWIIFVKDVRKALKEGNSFPPFAKTVFLFIGVAFSVKLLLQLGSVAPELSKLAFGFRSVVIAYLHLVLLAVISVFLLAYFFTRQFIQSDKKMITALIIFLVGVFLNEAFLAVQGIASFAYFPIKHINELLFVAAVMLAVGSLLIVIFHNRKDPLKI